MSNVTASKDLNLEWLKRVLQKHFKHAWPRIAARLEARQLMPMDASARTRDRATNVSER